MIKKILRLGLIKNLRCRLINILMMEIYVELLINKYLIFDINYFV